MQQLFLPGGRQPVVLEFAITVWGWFPLGTNPASLLEPVERWIQRTVLHLEKIVSRFLNMLCDLMTMQRCQKQGLQNQHVERSLEKVDSFFIFSH